MRTEPGQTCWCPRPAGPPAPKVQTPSQAPSLTPSRNAGILTFEFIIMIFYSGPRPGTTGLAGRLGRPVVADRRKTAGLAAAGMATVGDRESSLQDSGFSSPGRPCAARMQCAQCALDPAQS